MLRTLLPLLALLPGLAAAEPTRTYGVSFEPGGAPSKLEMAYCEAGCFAQVTFDNTYLYGDAMARKFPLDLDGLAVTASILDGEGMNPEVFSLEVPPGYVAQPAEIPVDEGRSATIAIIPMPMS